MAGSIDCGIGNLQSVQWPFGTIGVRIEISLNACRLRSVRERDCFLDL